MLDPEHAPGRETSGTAFFTYGLLWGINNGGQDSTGIKIRVRPFNKPKSGKTPLQKEPVGSRNE
ncbi:glycoside hydrolase family 88 protein [Sphingobacterium sp.]|uniref:glycoside hydrolase family 88 protein n=1 Tax=Sphingobacterium sp. TaxID=341027 RepID=UPI002FDE1F4E